MELSGVGRTALSGFGMRISRPPPRGPFPSRWLTAGLRRWQEASQFEQSPRDMSRPKRRLSISETTYSSSPDAKVTPQISPLACVWRGATPRRSHLSLARRRSTTASRECLLGRRGLPPASRASSRPGPQRSGAKWLQYVSVVATDLADLRSALDTGNPIQTELIRWCVHDSPPPLLVFKTRTAAKAFQSVLKEWQAKSEGGRRRFVGLPAITWLSQLATQSPVPFALVVGSPPRSAWHRLDSGLARELDVVVIGPAEAKRVEVAAAAVRNARARWASLKNRERVWLALIDNVPPEPPIDVPVVAAPEVESVEGARLRPQQDVFSPLGSLLRDDRRLLEEEGETTEVAREVESGQWLAFVDAVEVETDLGRLLLPADSDVDILEPDGEPGEVVAASLKPGMQLIIGREAGRVGLLDALEARLQHKPAILAARLLLRSYREAPFPEIPRVRPEFCGAASPPEGARLPQDVGGGPELGTRGCPDGATGLR